MFDNFGYGNPAMPTKRKNGLLGEDDYALNMGAGSQAALDQASAQPAEDKGLLGFWQGGDKFRGRDAIGGLLAVIGDAFTQQGGGQGTAISGLAGGRAKAIAEAQAAAKQQQLIQAGIAAGRSPEQMNLILGGAADYNDFKPEALPEKVRTSQWYANASEADRKALDAIDPIVTNGYGSTVVPRSTFSNVGGTVPGTIEDGYQFVGGDDKDQNNWRPVQGGAGSSPRPFRR